MTAPKFDKTKQSKDHWYPQHAVRVGQQPYSESQFEDLAQLYQANSNIEARDFTAPRYVHGYGHMPHDTRGKKGRPQGTPHVRSNYIREEPSIRRMAGIAGLAVLAIITGTGLGYLSAQPQIFNTASIVERAGGAKAPSVASTAINVRNILGTAETPIPLNITSQSPDGSLAYRFTGLPGDAYLTAGVEIEDGNWLVKAKDLPNIGLVVPHYDSGTAIDLQVSAIEPQSGTVAHPAQQIKVAIGGKQESPPPESPMEASVEAKTAPEIAPLQAAGDPGVAGDGKSNAESLIQPANAAPETTILAEPEKQAREEKPKKTLKKLLFGE